VNRINPADYILPDGLTDAEVAERLTDPLVRICNIYKIRDADGVVRIFCPNEPQCEVLWQVYVKGTKRIAIPKARQLGISTLIALIIFDRANFGNDVNGAIVDATQPAAQGKLAMVKFAWEKMDDELKDAAVEDSKGALGWANGSLIIAGLRARGRTLQVLHISEWGPIAFEDAARSEEIVTGAIPSASGKNAWIFAESTHKGGKGGDWYNLIKRSVSILPEHRTDEDFLVMFFAWWREKRYTLEGDTGQITREVNQYLDQKEMQITVSTMQRFRFTPGQRLFYFKKREALGRKIYAEFPTTLEECWMAPTPGAIYSAEVDKARITQRISKNVGWYQGFPVYSAFDIGAAVNTKCWLFQAIGDRINLLECLTGGDDCNTPAAWAKRLKEKQYAYGGHFLPHDGETLWRNLMVEAGLKGVVVMPRVIDEWDNINDALQAFSRCYFNEDGCEEGLDGLEAFRSKQEADGVTIRNVPVHDWASHASTAFGYIHQAIRLGMLVDRSAIPAVPKNPAQAHRESKVGLRSNHNPAAPRRVLR
jgi:hypothetical protein